MYIKRSFKNLCVKLFNPRLNDLKVVYVICAAVIGVLVATNLTIGFATTGRGEKAGRGGCKCGRGSATGCVVKSVFVINYTVTMILFVTTVLFLIALFLCYIMTRLCNEGRFVTASSYDRGYIPPNIDFGESDQQQIDMRQFAPILNLRSNETHLLIFQSHRLKKLCVDYMANLNFYTILSSLGFILIFIGFINYLINLSVNWARLSTKQKYAELVYINGAEMIAFGSDSVTGDVNQRF